MKFIFSGCLLLLGPASAFAASAIDNRVSQMTATVIKPVTYNGASILDMGLPGVICGFLGYSTSLGFTDAPVTNPAPGSPRIAAARIDFNGVAYSLYENIYGPTHPVYESITCAK